MNEKESSSATNKKERHRLSHSSRRRIILCFSFIITLVSITLIVVFATWAILKPSKPRFILQDATVFNFNVSGEPPNFLTSNFQITLSSRNPNDKIAIFYDRLDVYATYQNQQITFPTTIPAVYQGHKEVIVWSPFVGGDSVPVAPYNGLSLGQDQTRGMITLVVCIDGRVRWKVGELTTGEYYLYVKCPANINFGNSGAGVNVGGNAIKYMLTTRCTVSVWA